MRACARARVCVCVCVCVCDVPRMDVYGIRVIASLQGIDTTIQVK